MPSYEQSTLIGFTCRRSPRRAAIFLKRLLGKRFQVAVAEDAKCKSALFLELQTAYPRLTIPTARSLSVLAQPPNHVALRQPNFNPHFPDEALSCAARAAPIQILDQLNH